MGRAMRLLHRYSAGLTIPGRAQEKWLNLQRGAPWLIGGSAAFLAYADGLGMIDAELLIFGSVLGILVAVYHVASICQMYRTAQAALVSAYALAMGVAWMAYPTPLWVSAGNLFSAAGVVLGCIGMGTRRLRRQAS